jgi:hypothetical protein
VSSEIFRKTNVEEINCGDVISVLKSIVLKGALLSVQFSFREILEYRYVLLVYMPELYNKYNIELYMINTEAFLHFSLQRKA